ncbi:MAG: heliorhodopsin HeR [Actinomycetota bacterium]
MTETTTQPAPDLTDGEADRLRRLNLIFGLVHLASGVLMVALANDFSLPVTTTYLDDIPGGDVDPERLENQFDVRLGWATAKFLFLSAFFHLLIVSPLGAARYRREIANGRNRFRWVEYSLSSTLMIVLIAMLVGVSDLAALIAIGGVNAAMILFGWIMEVVNDLDDDRPVWWTPFWFGCVAGVVPWVAVGAYLFGPGSDVPNFVYGIYVSIFLFFNVFALNQYLQYRRVGKWADYVHGERAYIWLSITAKSALAWQIYGNTLAG